MNIEFKMKFLKIEKQISDLKLKTENCYKIEEHEQNLTRISTQLTIQSQENKELKSLNKKRLSLLDEKLFNSDSLVTDFRTSLL